MGTTYPQNIGYQQHEEGSGLESQKGEFKSLPIISHLRLKSVLLTINLIVMQGNICVFTSEIANRLESSSPRLLLH